MKSLCCLFFVSLSLLRADDITLTDGTVFKNAKIIDHNAKSVTISFAAGVAMVKIELVPPNLLPEPILAGFPGSTPTPAASDSDAPKEIDPRIKAATDKGGMNSEGTIAQVKPDGVIVDLAILETRMTEVPHQEQKTIDLVPQGLGHTPVNQIVTKTWTTMEPVSDRKEIGVAFVACETDDIDPVDRPPWSGHVWPVGAYSYKADDGTQHVIPKYTTHAEEAYKYFAQHPDEIPPAPADAGATATPVQTTTSLSTPSMNP